MRWTPELTQLRDILAYLYPTIQDSQRVLQEAGHSTQHIKFSGAANGNWHNILNEAIKHEGIVDELVNVALARYDRNVELAEAYAAYRESTEGTPSRAANHPEHEASERSSTPTIDTGGGAYIAGNVTVQGNFTGRDLTTHAGESADNDRSSTQQVKVLFLAANPADMPRLALDEEVRAIDQVLIQAQYRDHFLFEQHFAVQYGDLPRLLLHHQPDIVHFSGHGSEAGELLLQGENDQSHPIREEALSCLFSVLKDNIRCVVLNACYSEGQATAIAEHIDVVVGMKHVLGDDAARNFAAAFYQGLGFGRSVQTAFELGCLQIDLANLDEADEPQLKALHGGAAEMVFVSK